MPGGGFASRIPVDRLRGLRPRAWLCVGPGFSREEIKAHLLSRGMGFTGEAITSVEAICLRIVGAPFVLGSLARQEALRILLADRRIAARMPELKRLRRQGSFYRRLDHALQAGRMAFAHPEEGAVYAERLDARLGGNPVREEIQSLSLAYEAWLRGSGLHDLPSVVLQATEILQGEGWPASLARPEEIHVFSAQTEESRERAFWEALSAHVTVFREGPLQRSFAAAEADPVAEPWAWQLWHTLDDAADSLAERIAGSVFEKPVVLIPDSSGARRSLRRALESRGLALADPRDPTRIQWDEGLKWGLLPIEVVARGFERQKVLSYLRGHLMQGEYPAWVTEIHARGIRQGLGAYAGGTLSQVHSFLRELQESFGGRRTCAELSEAHLRHLRAAVAASSPGSPDPMASRQDPTRLWTVPFFESLWKEFIADMGRVGLGDQRAPLLYWWERLQARLAETPAPVEKVKASDGVATYRLHQAPLATPAHVVLFGLPPQWLAGEGVGDAWFSERDREVLAADFAVRSGFQVRQERLAALCAWLGNASRVTVLDATYDPEGRERETTEAVLRETVAQLGLPAETLPDRPEERGSHPRWARSYGALRPLQPQSVELPPLPPQPGGRPPEITATALDSYSRCGIQALAYHRWRLRDARPPDADPWPEARGNILHEAVKILLMSRDAEGAFGAGLEEALERAWKLQRPKGLIRSQRTERYAKAKMLQVLEGFRDKEREYFARAPSRIASLDDTRFRLDFHGVSIVGTPDRVDEHPEGLFILDYKTSSALPHGTDMLELGYRLQLPFYALAARRQLGKPVLGVQFVELNRKGGRGSGVFFKRYNGKDAGKLTNLRANSKSLLAAEPEDAWARLEEHLVDHARAYVGGRFEARPKRKEKECATCAISDLCGYRRLSEGESEPAEGPSGDAAPGAAKAAKGAREGGAE